MRHEVHAHTNVISLMYSAALQSLVCYSQLQIHYKQYILVTVWIIEHPTASRAFTPRIHWGLAVAAHRKARLSARIGRTLN